MNLGMETETVEHKKSTSEMREGMESIASILNKRGHGTLCFGVRPSDGEVIG
jgi:ATP-dependent DNA helicase RecG